MDFSKTMRDLASSGIYNRNKRRLGLGNRQPAQAPSQQGGAIAPGFGGQPRTMMSSTLPTAAESGAFNERKKNRALYGKYGKGGIERDRMANAKAIEDAKNKTAMGIQRDRRAGALERRASERAGALERERIKSGVDQDRVNKGYEIEKQKVGGMHGRYNPRTGMWEKGTERITAEAKNAQAARAGMQKPIFEDFETPNPEDPLTPLKTKGRYNPQTGQFDPVGIQGGQGPMPNQAAVPEEQVVRKPTDKKKKWNDFVTP